MEKELTYLLGIMNEEIIYDWSEVAHSEVNQPHPRFVELNPGFSAKVRDQYSRLLEERCMSTLEYYRLTGIDFESSDAMYEFLAAAFEFIFEGKHQDDPPYPEY